MLRWPSSSRKKRVNPLLDGHGVFGQTLLALDVSIDPPSAGHDMEVSPESGDAQLRLIATNGRPLIVRLESAVQCKSHDRSSIVPVAGRKLLPEYREKKQPSSLPYQHHDLLPAIQSCSRIAALLRQCRPEVQIIFGAGDRTLTSEWPRTLMAISLLSL